MVAGETFVESKSFRVSTYCELEGNGTVQGMCVLDNGCMLLSKVGKGICAIGPWGKGGCTELSVPQVRSARGVTPFRGNVLVCDAGSHCVWMMSPSGRECQVFIGAEGVAGWKDGRGSVALLRQPSATAVSPDQRAVCIADTGNHMVRVAHISSDLSVQSVVTIAGMQQYGMRDGVYGASLLYNPTHVLWDSEFIAVTDTGNHSLRLIRAEGSTWVTSTVAGSRQAGLREGKQQHALFNHPCNATMTSGGALLVADKNNSRIRAIANNEVTTLCGSRKGHKVGCYLHAALFNSPSFIICLGINDTLFIADARGVYMVKKEKQPAKMASPILGTHPNAPPYAVKSFVYSPPKTRPMENQPVHTKKPSVPVLLNKKVVADVSIHTHEDEPLQITPVKKASIERNRDTPSPSVSPVTAKAEQDLATVFSKWATSSSAGKTMSCTQWLRLLGHCRLLKVVGDTRSHHAVTTARAGIIFVSATGSGERMSFPVFCHALAKLAGSLTPSMSIEKLILGCIGPLAGHPPADALATFNPSILKPHVLMLLAANEAMLLSIFKWFVSKHPPTQGSNEDRHEVKVRGKLLSMTGWLAFLRKFRIMPDLQGRQAGESFAVHAVSGTLFAALVRGSQALQAEMEAIKRVDIHKRPDAPVLLCFPEFLDAICRTAFACYGKTLWDLSRYPTPVDQLSALLNAMAQSEGADTFGSRPIFEVPVGVTSSPSPSLRKVPVYAEKYRGRDPDCQVLMPSLMTTLSESPDKASAVSESLASIDGRQTVLSGFSALSQTMHARPNAPWSVQQDSSQESEQLVEEISPISPSLNVYHEKPPSWPVIDKSPASHARKKRKKSQTRESTPTPSISVSPVLVENLVTTVHPKQPPTIRTPVALPGSPGVLLSPEQVTRFSQSFASDHTDIDESSISYTEGHASLQVEEVFSDGGMSQVREVNQSAELIVLSDDDAPSAKDDLFSPDSKKCPTIPYTGQIFTETLEETIGVGRSPAASSSSQLTFATDSSKASESGSQSAAASPSVSASPSPSTSASPSPSASASRSASVSDSGSPSVQFTYAPPTSASASSPTASSSLATPHLFAASAAELSNKSSLLSPISPQGDATWDESDDCLDMLGEDAKDDDASILPALVKEEDIEKLLKLHPESKVAKMATSVAQYRNCVAAALGGKRSEQYYVEVWGVVVGERKPVYCHSGYFCTLGGTEMMLHVLAIPGRSGGEKYKGKPPIGKIAVEGSMMEVVGDVSVDALLEDSSIQDGFHACVPVRFAKNKKLQKTTLFVQLAFTDSSSTPVGRLHPASVRFALFPDPSSLHASSRALLNQRKLPLHPTLIHLSSHSARHALQFYPP